MVSAGCLLGSCCVVSYAVCYTIPFVVGLCSLCGRCVFDSLVMLVYFYFDVIWGFCLDLRGFCWFA